MRPTPSPRTDPAPARTGAAVDRVSLGVAAAVVVIGALVAVARPAVVQGVLGSPRAIAIVVGIIAAAVGWSALLRRWGLPDGVRAGLLALPVAVVLALAVGPYFMADEVVDVALPGVAVAPAGPAPDPAAPPPADPELADAEPAAQAATTPPPVATSPPAVATTTPPTSSADAAPADPPPPAGPVELTRGSFVGLDGHTAAGTAAVYDVGAGARVVRLEDVDLQRVPDAHVYLVPAAGAEAPGEGAIHLGPLTGNVGSSNYAVPADADLGAGPDLPADLTVLVWCEAFASPVGGATQQPVATG